MVVKLHIPQLINLIYFHKYGTISFTVKHLWALAPLSKKAVQTNRNGFFTSFVILEESVHHHKPSHLFQTPTSNTHIIIAIVPRGHINIHFACLNFRQFKRLQNLSIVGEYLDVDGGFALEVVLYHHLVACGIGRNCPTFACPCGRVQRIILRLFCFVYRIPFCLFRHESCGRVRYRKSLWIRDRCFWALNTDNRWQLCYQFLANTFADGETRVMKTVRFCLILPLKAIENT